MRAKPEFRLEEQQDSKPRRDHRAAAAVSLSYLKAAAEKKKARDREFAVRAWSSFHSFRCQYWAWCSNMRAVPRDLLQLELLREETEYKKKISLKIVRLLTIDGATVPAV